MAPMSIADRRKLLFTPCTTKAHFRLWVQEFLNIDLPDCTVSEESTSNPLDAAWDYYDRILRNDLVGHSRVMTYACRGGFKTLSASILETMTLLHTRRNIGHMAAIEAQSKKSASYIKDYFEMEILRDFVSSMNSRGIRVVRYIHDQTGEVLNEAEAKELSAKQRLKYTRYENYLKIVVCTMSGANSDHTELFIVDETDVIPRQHVPAYYQAQNIPDPRDGMLPLTILTSTRKSRIGLVQTEINNSEKTGLRVLHWNLIDVSARCEPERHEPEKPKVTYYVNDDQLRHITQDEYDILNPGAQKKWYPVEGFAGCKGCKIFSACKGRLATHQTSNSPMLKPISFAIEKFNSAPTADFISTEYLCRKPDASGLVYPKIAKDTHLKTAAEMAKLVTGEDYPPDMNKAELIQILKTHGAKFFAGMDFGFTHKFAVTTMAQFAQYVFVLDCYMESGLELEEQIFNTQYLKTIYGNPTIWPDMASPPSILTFRKKGYKVRTWEKKPFSVKAGIEIVRSLLMNSRGVTRMLFLKGDPGISALFKQMEDYKLQTNMAGEPTEEPEKKDDDGPDSLRYGAMNELGNKGSLKEPTADSGIAIGVPQDTDVDSPGNYLKNFIKQELASDDGDPGFAATRVKKGGFSFTQ